MAAEEIKLKCQFCSQVFHSTYRLIPHVFMAHHKKVAKKIARNKGFRKKEVVDSSSEDEPSSGETDSEAEQAVSKAMHGPCIPNVYESRPTSIAGPVAAIANGPRPRAPRLGSTVM